MKRLIIPTCGALVLPLLCARAVLGGPQHGTAQSWADAIDRAKPGVIMVGSSMQGEGINFRVLSKAIGAPVFDARSGGSMPPWKYCFLKYVIPKAKHTPKVVIVITRLNYIVCPQKRMRWHVYQQAVNKIAGEDRVLLDKLAFSNEGRPKWQYNYDMAAGPPYDSYYWDFNKAVKTTFLPHMIELAKQGGYQLVIVRYKSRKYAEDPKWEPPEVKKFGEDMAVYLHAHGVIFVDYAYHPAIKIEHYGKGDHLSRQTGRPIWTELMGEDLKAILAGSQAPNHRLPAGKAKSRQAKESPTSRPTSRDTKRQGDARRPTDTNGA